MWAAVVTPLGCKTEFDPEVVGHGLPDTTSTGAAIPQVGPRCELDEAVPSPQPGTPEEVVQAVLSAAADLRDEEAAFQRFYERFDPSQDKEWVRTQYWKAARNHIEKLLPPDHDRGEAVPVVVCRRDTPGAGKVKLFVKSYDMQKNHLPITLEKKDDGSWKVVGYSP
jgi:hypothetical protein